MQGRKLDKGRFSTRNSAQHSELVTHSGGTLLNFLQSEARELNGVTCNNTACIENLLQGRLSSCTSRLEEKMFWMTLCGLVVLSYHLANSTDGYTAEYCTDWKRLLEVKVFFSITLCR